MQAPGTESRKTDKFPVFPKDFQAFEGITQDCQISCISLGFSGI